MGWAQPTKHVWDGHWAKHVWDGRNPQSMYGMGTGQASVSRKMKDSEMATHWTFIYQINSKMRAQINGSTEATRVFFEFSQKAM
jgi:hypothetical protein